MSEGKLFDLVLIDMILEEMDGETTALIMRRLEGLFGVFENTMHLICGMAIILPQNYNLKDGFDHMLEKPVTS